MNEEPDPYAPPRADLPAGAEVVGDSGSLWRVVEGRLQVRHMAQLPDVCLSGGAAGEPGGRHSVFMRRIPGWLTGAVWLTTGFLALPGWLPLKFGGIFILSIVNALPLAETPPRVLFFRSHSSLREGRLRAWAWFVPYAAIVGGTFLFHRSKDVFEAGGTFNIMTLGLGAWVLVRSFCDRGYGRARKLADGWFELLGIPSSVIARLEEIQQGKPPAMQEPRL